MSKLIHVSKALPRHTLDLEEIRRYAHIAGARWGRNPEVLLRIINNAEVGTRQSIMPLEEIVREKTFKERNDLFIKYSIELGSRAVERCLEETGRRPEDIDLFITVSCTGFMIPSVDSFIMERLGFRRDCRRLPITELGCAAGAVALSRADDFIRGYPDAHVLILAHEFPSVTFQLDDANMAHVVSAIIFGDGVACALVGPSEGEGPLSLLGSRSYLFPDSSHYMGFDVDGLGFHIILDKCVPNRVRDTIREQVEAFGALHGIGIGDLRFYALHTAGRKVLNYMEDELGISPEMTRATWHVLKHHGNMSSVSVLYVLKSLLEDFPPQANDLGMIMAFGPGFSAELLLARWEG